MCDKRFPLRPDILAIALGLHEVRLLGDEFPRQPLELVAQARNLLRIL